MDKNISIYEYKIDFNPTLLFDCMTLHAPLSFASTDVQPFSLYAISLAISVVPFILKAKSFINDCALCHSGNLNPTIWGLVYG